MAKKAQMPNAVANELCDLLGAAASGGSMVFYASGGTAIASLPLNSPAFGAAALGVAAMIISPNPVDGSAAASRTIHHAALLRKGGTQIFDDLTCGTTESYDVTLSSLSVVAGDELKITTAGTIKVPTSRTA